jgi:hypothetical protein
MAGEVLQFRCPCCGQHAPIERITEEGPFEFEVFVKTLGGKRKLSEDERKARRGQRFPRGSGPGRLDYEPTRTLKSHRDALNKRLQELKG